MRPWLALVALLVIVAGTLAALASTARAHDDPDECTDTGITISLAVFRNDETTVISGDNFVTHGETIKYQVTLSSPGAPNCAFEGGELTITDPGGEPHDVTPAGGIPQIGGADGDAEFKSEFVEYEVAHGDELGPDDPRVRARVQYDDGFFHSGENHGDLASGSTTITRTVAHDLEIEKDAVPAIDRTFTWDIEKGVVPNEWNLFDGDTGTSDYTVEVTKSEPDDSHSVTGTITIENPNDFAVDITDITDTISGGVGNVPVTCEHDATTVVIPDDLPFELPGGDTLTCTYASDLPDDADRINTVNVFAEAEQTGGEVAAALGGTDTAPIDFDGVVPTVDDTNEVTITDTNEPEFGGPHVIDESETFEYSVQFDCSEVDFDEGFGEFTHENTAEIEETEQTSMADVDVDCWQLEVTKDVEGEAEREWDWTVLKTAAPPSQTINEGESAVVNWEIQVGVADPDPDLSDVAISGEIEITNLNPDREAIITNVTDMFDTTVATVDCGVDFGADETVTLAPAGQADDTLTCDYSGSAEEVDELENTATATQQNHDYDSSNVGTPSGETEHEGSATLNDEDVDITEIDFCVLVEDPDIDSPVNEIVCAGENPDDHPIAPQTFTGSNTYEPETLVCGINEVENTATITEQTNTDQTDSSTAFATIEVICEEFEGCTPGFWRTHSSFAPGNQDDLWVDLDAEDRFNETFGVDWFDDEETLQDIMLQPGGLRTLGFHVIAAQLNINSEIVNYGLTQQDLDDLIDDVSNDLISVSDAIDILTEHNEAGCPDASEFEPTNENDNQPGPPAGRGPR